MQVIKLFTVILFICAASLFNAQKDKKIDQLIKSANTLVFKNPQKSIEIGNSILKDKNISTGYKISSYMLISNGYSALNDFQRSIEFAITANELSEQSNDHANQIRTLGLIGNQYIRIEMRDEAWHYLNRADKLSQTVKLPDSMKYLIGNINLLKGFLYKRSLDCGHAIKNFNRAISDFQKNRGNGFAVVNLGQAYIHKGYCMMPINKDSAQISFQKGLMDARKNGAKALECNALIGLCQIMTARKEYHSSTDTLQNALLLSKEIRQTEMENRIYRILSENDLATNNFERHLHYQKMYDSTHAIVIADDVKSVNEIIQKRNEFKHINDASKEKKYRIILSILLLILIFISFFSFYFIKKKIKKLPN